MRIRHSLCAALLLASALASVASAQEQPASAVDPSLAEAEKRIQEALGKRVDESVQRGIGIQVRRIPGTSLVAVLHDIDLEAEFLMVRLRIFNDGAEPARLVIDAARAYESFFVEVDGEKRFIQRDESGNLDAKGPLAVDVRPGSMASWWARFPALPADTRWFHIVIPPVSPFLNVPADAD